MYGKLQSELLELETLTVCEVTGIHGTDPKWCSKCEKYDNKSHFNFF